MQQPFQTFNHAVPFLFLGVLALMSFWLNEMVQNEPPFNQKEHIPDSYAYNIQMLQFDQNGILRYELHSPEIQHFPDDNSAALINPMVIAHKDNAPPITIYGKDAVVTEEAEVIYLYNGTTITRPPFQKRGFLKAQAPYFVVLPNSDFAFTNSDFLFSENEKSWVKSIGAELFLDRSVLHLKSKVTSFIQPEMFKK